MNPEQFGVVADLGPTTAVKLLISFGLFMAAGLLRWLPPRLLKAEGPISDSRRWWINFLRNLGTIGLFLGLIAAWSEEIGDFALSIAAFALALVIAVKEILLCVAGAFWRGIAAPFSVGDWIEIEGYSGEVVEENLMATRLQEIDWHDFRPTGRVVSVPNSLLLTEKIVNHTFRKRYIYLVFELHSEPHAGALDTRRRIQTAMETECANFAETAARYVKWIERNVGAQFRDPAPRVKVYTTDFAKLVYRVTVFCPRERAGEIREAAFEAYLGADAFPPPADTATDPAAAAATR